MRQQGRFFDSLAPEFLKYSSILILGTGIGLFSALISPIIACIGTAGFAAVAIFLYANTYSRPHALVNTVNMLDEALASRYRLLFFFCYLSFFISVTIPKSGRTISGIPVTSANILILCAFMIWFFNALFSQRLVSQIPLFKLLLLFMCYGAINSSISLLYHNPLKMILIEFIAFFGFIPCYFLACCVLKTRQRIRMLVSLIIISLGMVCLYGMAQLRYGFENIAVPGITEQYEMIHYAEFGGRWNYIEGGRQKLYSTFQNGNIFGNHLAMFLPFLGGIILIIQPRWRKIVVSGIFIGAWYTLFLTYSRGALLAGIVGVFVLAVVAKRIHFRAFGVLLVFIISLFIFLNEHANRPESGRYNFRRLVSDPNQFSAGRLQRFESAVKKFQQLPLLQKVFGIGLGANLVVDNLYVYLFIKLGIVGFSLLFLILGKLFLTLMKLRTNLNDGEFQGLMNGGIAGLAASLVHNIADVLWLFPPLAANFWFLAGLTMSIGVIGSQMNQAEPSPVTIKKQRF